MGYVICPGVFYVPITRTLEAEAIYTEFSTRGNEVKSHQYEII